MKFTEYDMKNLLDSGIIELEKLGHKKGSVMIFYHGNHYYLWRENNRVILQKKWFWSKKYCFELLELE